MTNEHQDLTQIIQQIAETAQKIEGCMTDREARFLALLASYPTAPGEILEIGSFKGRSTVILAKGASVSDGASVSAVDPLSCPATTDPELAGETSTETGLVDNLKKAGVIDGIEFHKKYSGDLAKEWDRNRKLRLLWIDGDHTYPGVKLDFDSFAPYLMEGGIIAFHDVLDFEGPVRVFLENILLSDNFGPAGMVGGIGWAQYSANTSVGQQHHKQKMKLYLRLSKMVPLAQTRRFNGEKLLEGFSKRKYKYHRALVPHAEPSPEQWIAQVHTRNQLQAR